MLVTGAANPWNVPAAEIETSNSVLTHASGRHATYGEMAEAAGRLAVPKDVRLKKPSQFTLIGKQTGTPRVLDASGKLAGWQHTIVGQSIFGGTALASYTIKDGVDAMSVEGVFPSQYAIPQMRGAFIRRNCVSRRCGCVVLAMHIVSSNAAPTGVGEPGVPPLAPAVVKAMARLGVARVWRLPLARAGLVAL